MHYTAAQVAELVEGRVAGKPEVEITHLVRIEDGGPGGLSFLHSPKYYSFLDKTTCAAVLVPEDFAPKKPPTSTLIHVANPYEAFNKLLHIADSQRHPAAGVEAPHYVAQTAKIGEGVYLGAFSYIGEGTTIADGVKIYPNVVVGANVRIGRNSILYPNVTVYHDCVIGADCILHSGVVVGSDGFGFLQDEEGRNRKIPQIGHVVLEDDVEIGANSVVDRATLGATVVRQGVKLDNFVQIAHNCEIGAQTVMAGYAGVSGSTKIGAHCMIGGQVGIAGHLRIADRIQVGAQSGITKSFKRPGEALRGSPAQNIRQQFKLEANQRRIPEILQRLEALEALLNTATD